MPGSRSRIVSKDAHEKLSNAAFDFDVRPHKLLDAIAVLTDWERHTDKLVGYIRKIREERLGSESGLESGPETGIPSGHTERRVPSGLSGVPVGSETGPEKIEKSEKKTRDRPVSASVGSLSGLSGPSEARNRSLSVPSRI